MPVVIIILKILGFTLLGVVSLLLFAVLLILILSVFRVTFTVSYDGSLFAGVNYLFIKKKLLPPDEEPENKKNSQQDTGTSDSCQDKNKASPSEGSEKSRTEATAAEKNYDEKNTTANNKKNDNSDNTPEDAQDKKNKKSFFSSFTENLGFSDYINILKIFFDKFISKIYVEDFEIDARISGDDAYDTAMIYGKLNAAVYPLAGILYNSGKIKNMSVNISPDFSGKESEYKGRAEITARVFYFLAFMVTAVWYIIKNRNKS